MLVVFRETFFGILQVFLVMLAAGILVRRKIVTQAHITGLSSVAVAVFMPCLAFSNITHKFSSQPLERWWLLPLAAVVMVGGALVMSSIAFINDWRTKKNMIAIASIQNAGYMVLPVGQALFPAKFEGEFSVYCFLYVLALNPLLWSIGKHLVTSSGKEEKLSWKGLVTPPLAATLAALLISYIGWDRFITGGVMDKGITMLGQAAVPVATFVLGASLGSVQLRIRPYLFDAVCALGIKLLIVPALTLLAIWALGLHHDPRLLGEFLIIEAAAAPATALILQVRHYGGDEEKVGSVLFVGYIICAATLPFWYAVWVLLRHT